MRITNQMMINKFLTNVRKSTVKMDATMEKLSTGQTISRPSDDPGALAELMALKKGLNQTEQYIKNINYVEGLLNTTEVSIGKINDILNEAKQLAVMGANSTWNETDRANMAEQVQQLKEHLLDVANTKYEGKYIFARYDLTQKPFESDFTMRDEELTGELTKKMEIAPNITIDLLNDGKEIFKTDGTETSLFSTIQNLSDFIRSGDIEKVSGMIKDIEDLANHFLNERVKAGMKGSRVEMARAKYEDEAINLSTMIAKIGDADMAEVMMNYKMQETVYQSALVSGTKIMGISLLDYIK